MEFYASHSPHVTSEGPRRTTRKRWFPSSCARVTYQKVYLFITICPAFKIIVSKTLVPGLMRPYLLQYKSESKVTIKHWFNVSTGGAKKKK